MYPYLRLARVLIKKKFQPKLDFYSRDSDTIPLMVLPQDIDPFLELNNGRYVTLLDLGRYGYGTRVDINGFLKRTSGRSPLLAPIMNTVIVCDCFKGLN